MLSFCYHVTVFNGHFLFLSCDLFFNGHFLFLPSPPVSMVKPLYAVFMYMKVCCIVYLSIEMYIRHCGLCTQFLWLWKCFLSCTGLLILLNFVSLSLLMALNLSLHSGKWWTASLKLCVPIHFLETIHVWLNNLTQWNITSSFETVYIEFSEWADNEPREPELKKSLWGYVSLISLHLFMRDGQESRIFGTRYRYF